MSFYPGKQLAHSVALAADETTSSLSAVDVPTMSLSFTPQRAHLRVIFDASLQKTAGAQHSVFFQVLVSVNGGAFSQIAGTGCEASNQISASTVSVSTMCEALLGVTPGVPVVIKVQWNVDGFSATCDASSAAPTQSMNLEVIEL